MRNKIFIPITFFLLLISCTSEKTKTPLSLESSQSWDVIEGIMLKNWDKEKIESVIGKSKKFVGNSTILYFDEDTKLQRFAIEYNPNQKVSVFSFSPQEYEASMFTLEKIRSHWKDFKCMDKESHISHPDFIETKFWLECSNDAKVFYNIRKEVLFITAQK